MHFRFILKFHPKAKYRYFCVCIAWLLEAACVRLTDKLVLHSLQQCLVCIFRLHGSRAFPCQHGADQVLPAAWKKAQTYACKWNATFKMFFLIVAFTTFHIIFQVLMPTEPRRSLLHPDWPKRGSGFYTFIQMFFFLLTKDWCSCSTHTDSNLKKRGGGCVSHHVPITEIPSWSGVFKPQPSKY